MKLTITNKQNNPLLGRLEVKFKVEHEKSATPGKGEVADLLAAKLNANQDLMFIKEYTTSFGMNESQGLCLVYENEKTLNRAESHRNLNPKKRVGKSPAKAEEAGDNAPEGE
ncbi:MAG TPA: hypothetical protein ENN60_00105 [archaeon]|nr:hypothetical protein [archaeon]